MGNYIQWIRERVGHERIFLNFAAAFILDDAGRILLQKIRSAVSTSGLRFSPTQSLRL